MIEHSALYREQRHPSSHGADVTAIPKQYHVTGRQAECCYQYGNTSQLLRVSRQSVARHVAHARVSIYLRVCTCSSLRNHLYPAPRKITKY